MTKKMIKRAVEDAQSLSIRYGRSYLMSNSRMLIPVCSEISVKFQMRKGFWIEAVYENGRQIAM